MDPKAQARHRALSGDDTGLASRQRLRERATGPSISDGRAEIFDEFANAYEPVLELDTCEHVVLDTSGPVGESSPD
jgi:hypothetical protein